MPAISVRCTAFQKVAHSLDFLLREWTISFISQKLLNHLLRTIQRFRAADDRWQHVTERSLAITGTNSGFTFGLTKNGGSRTTSLPPLITSFWLIYRRS
jgi:hypothetical protein